jgi:thiamine pyrophosphokinase
MTTVLVLTGGQPGPPGFQDADYVIAADSGLHRAGKRHVHLVIGDLDSVDFSALAGAEAAGAEVRRFPTAKDETDLELAIAAAVEHGAERVVIEGGFGQRLDHFLNTANVITSDRWSNLQVEWWDDRLRALVVRSEATLEDRIGQIVSLVPYGGPAAGVTLDGFEYPLDSETLPAGSGRGLSNVITNLAATVTVESGVLLLILAQ